jgi:hypothetical protein
MIDARQYPLFLKNKRRSIESQGLSIATKNTGDLPKRTVISCGVSHHEARDKANVAAIDPARHPNCCDCRLLFPLNHQLNLLEAHHNVLL